MILRYPYGRMKLFRSWTLLGWILGLPILGAVAALTELRQADLVLVACFSVLLVAGRLRTGVRSRRMGRKASREEGAAAQQREETLALLRETLESTADGFLLLNNEGRVVSFNRKLTELSGLSAADFAGGSMERLVAWMLERVIDPEGFITRLAELQTSREVEARDELRLRDGRVFERFTRPHRIGGRVEGRVWSFREVTAERAALDALHRREQQLAEAQRIASIGSWDWDLKTNRVVISEELRRIAGAAEAGPEWSFDGCLARVHPEDRDVIASAIHLALHGGTPFDADVRVVRTDGGERFVAVRGRVVADPEGRPLRLFGTAQDVSAQRRSAASLERSVRVEQSLTQLSRLLAEATAVNAGRALSLLGEALGADRLYLLQSRSDGDSVEMVRAEEWCAPGVEPARRHLTGNRSGPPGWAAQQLLDTGRLLLPRVSELPAEAARERALLESQGVGSAAAVSIPDLRQGLNGLLGLDYGQGREATEEDVRVLRTAGEILVTHFARDRAEREIARRDAILEAVSFLAERLLRSGDWRVDLDDVLSRIGAAAAASRAYLFQGIRSTDGSIRFSQRTEWVAEGVAPQLDDPELQSVRLCDLGFGPWEEVLARNQPVEQRVRELPPTGRRKLEAQGVNAVLLIPIFVNEAWWGFLGFDDRAHEREWSQAERDVLMAAGRIMGAGIQRKLADDALRESELRFKQLADNIPEVFFMTRADMSEVLYLSPSFEQVWQRPVEEAYANPRLVVESVFADDLPGLLADMEGSRAGRGESIRQLDYRIVRPDGSLRWIRNRVFQIPDERGRPYRVAGVCTDFTDQKQLEEDLRRAHRVEAIGHLAAGIAHEINTPIQYVGDNLCFLDESIRALKQAVGAYETLLQAAVEGTASDEVVREIASAVRHADLEYLLEEAPRASAQALDGVQRVAEIVRAMKEFSHPGSAIKVATDLNQAIRSTATVARNEWKYVAELITDLDEQLPPVLCLPGELNQAILNLLVNAAHAIAERQQADGGEEPGTILVRTCRSAGWVEVHVTDTGTGIAEAIRGRIFDPFFTTKEVGRGTGQGLTFVHSIVVEKHQGTISVDTEVGVGTTFTLRLPDLASSLAEVAA